MGEPQTMSAARFVGIFEILLPMFYISKRTIRKQSAEIEWSGLDSITETNICRIIRRSIGTVGGSSFGRCPPLGFSAIIGLPAVKGSLLEAVSSLLTASVRFKVHSPAYFASRCAINSARFHRGELSPRYTGLQIRPFAVSSSTWRSLHCRNAATCFLVINSGAVIVAVVIGFDPFVNGENQSP
jgi:hypothetical protein